MSKQMTNIEKLMQLAKENPNLPIIPLVDSEIVADDGYNWWMGSFGNVELGSYYVSKDRVYWDLDDLTEKILDDHCCDDKWEKLSDEETVKKAENIAKRKMKPAIIVYIELPTEK